MSDFRGPENGALDPSLWEPETGPSYPTSARPQAGFVGGSVDPAASPPSGADQADGGSGGVGASPTLGVSSAANAGAPSPDLSGRLRAMLLDMRSRQPTESAWLDHPELRRLRSDVDYLMTLVGMCVDLVTRREAR